VRPIATSVVIPQAPEAAFAFLADLRNHWRLERRFVALEDLEGDPTRRTKAACACSARSGCRG
jgi:hypothetical protein